MTEDNTAEVKGEAVEEDKEREKAMPSNVLEKGIIYFFVSQADVSTYLV